MSKRLTADDARQSLSAHVAARGADLFAKYGPCIGWNELRRILEDRACVRYPCKIAFDPAPLQPGECAYPKPNGDKPEDGFVIHIHPLFRTQMDRVARLALYQLVVVNYGEFASPDDAEIFGAAALGISREMYYQAHCQMADFLEDQRRSCGLAGPSTKKCRANDNSRKAETARPCDDARVKTNQNANAAGISGAA